VCCHRGLEPRKLLWWQRLGVQKQVCSDVRLNYYYSQNAQNTLEIWMILTKVPRTENDRLLCRIEQRRSKTGWRIFRRPLTSEHPMRPDQPGGCRRIFIPLLKPEDNARTIEFRTRDYKVRAYRSMAGLSSGEVPAADRPAMQLFAAGDFLG
jgi:hypothetical protein